MLYLIFLDGELSLCRGLNCTIVSLGSKTSCLWLYFQPDIRPWGVERQLEKTCHLVFLQLKTLEIEE